MPSVCRFQGIVIYLYYFDHAPPHFHAVYQQMAMEVGIAPVVILAGSLPAAQTTIVLRWAQKRQADLLADWALAHIQPTPPPLVPIQP